MPSDGCRQDEVAAVTWQVCFAKKNWATNITLIEPLGDENNRWVPRRATRIGKASAEPEMPRALPGRGLVTWGLWPPGLPRDVLVVAQFQVAAYGRRRYSPLFLSTMR